MTNLERLQLSAPRWLNVTIHSNATMSVSVYLPNNGGESWGTYYIWQDVPVEYNAIEELRVSLTDPILAIEIYKSLGWKPQDTGTKTSFTAKKLATIGIGDL